jgi:enamine deaminase RidA (YjgF/YER057c/UK114 family)
MTEIGRIGKLAATSWILVLAAALPRDASAGENRKQAGVVIEKDFLNPTGLNVPKGFTHVVTTRGGRLVFVTGQVAYDAKGEVVGKGDLKAQARQVYENLKTALAAAGATFADVVKSNGYVVGLKREDLTTLREVRAHYLPERDPPASTVVGVASLANPDCLIEIEVVAVVP